MPVKTCQLNGRKGYKWGDAGVCYIGPDAKAKATAQGLAALTSEAKRSGAKSKDEIDAYIKMHAEEI